MGGGKEKKGEAEGEFFFADAKLVASLYKISAPYRLMRYFVPRTNAIMTRTKRVNDPYERVNAPYEEGE